MTPELTHKKTRGRPRSVDVDKSATTVQALQRGLVLLGVLAKEDKATLTELALRTGMPPSSAHRLLITLQAHGYADFDDTTNMWMIGVETFRTGNSFLRRVNVVGAAREVMRELVAQTGESANLAIPDGTEVVFVSQVECSNPVRAFFGAGTRTPMHASGIGKALLAARSTAEVQWLLQKTGLLEFTPKTLTSPAALFADLEVIRARGWSFDDEERHIGVRCVAGAIYNEHGEATAGVSISGPSSRFSAGVVGEFGPMVKRASARITQCIGGAILN